MMSIFLLNLELCGVKNIEKPISFRFYKKTISKNFNAQDYRVKSIYGENGVGKTAVITGVKILRELILNAGYLSDSKTQKMLQNLVNKTMQYLEITVEFLNNIEGKSEIVKYHVCVENHPEEGGYVIGREDLTVKPRSNPKSTGQMIYAVENGEICSVAGKKADAEKIRTVTANLLLQRSMISLFPRIYHRTENSRFVLRLIDVAYFAASIKAYLNEEDRHDRFFLNQSMQNMLNLAEDAEDAEVKWRDFLRNMKRQMQGSVLKEYVSKSEFEEYENQIERLEQFLKKFKPDLQGILIDRTEDGDVYRCTLNFDYGGYKINEEFESTGIKKLMRMFESFDFASSGGIVFIDELDANINDVYLCKLIEYVAQYGKGQLCFTAHNLSPMRFLKQMKKSIDFMTADNRVISWNVNGNFAPENQFRDGMIEGCPLNIEASDFIGIFGRE